jgi:hypothetical protein
MRPGIHTEQRQIYLQAGMVRLIRDLCSLLQAGKDIRIYVASEWQFDQQNGFLEALHHAQRDKVTSWHGPGQASRSPHMATEGQWCHLTSNLHGKNPG